MNLNLHTMAIPWWKKKNWNSKITDKKTKHTRVKRTCDKLDTTGRSEAFAKKFGLLSNLQILGQSFWNAMMGGLAAHSTILAIHNAAPDWTPLFCSPIASNRGLTNNATTEPRPPLSPPEPSPFKYCADSAPMASLHESFTPESESLTLLMMWAIILVKWVEVESLWEAQTTVRSRNDSFFTAGFGSAEES